MSQVTVTDPAGGVVVLTVERPEKKNALSIAVRDGMSDALDRLANNDDVKVVIITGAGDVFSAGFDLREFERLDDDEFTAALWASSDRWHRTLIEFPLPTIAAVNGAPLPGGFGPRGMLGIRL